MGGKSFEWSGRKLNKVTDSNNNSIVTYTYDSYGKPYFSQKNGNSNSDVYNTTRSYSSNEIISETKSFYNGTQSSGYDHITHTLSYIYNAQGVIGVAHERGIEDPVLYTFRKNIFGDITEIYQGATCVAKYKYDAWGNCKVCNLDGSENTDRNFIGNLNSFRYRGYYWDSTVEMYHLQTRWYDPTIGRFISPDSYEYLAPETIGGLNLYAYCLNNPVNYKQRPVSSGGTAISSSISSITNGGIYSSGSVLSGSVGSSRVNWENNGFQIPIWISSLMSGSDFGASISPALRTIYQYIRYPGVKDLNKLYGLDFVPGKLNTVSSVIGYGLLGLNIGLSAWSNFTNDNLTTKQQWISFGVDTAYTLGTFGIGYGVGALVSLIPGVGVFIAPFVSAGVTWFIDWTNEKWSWLDDVKQWFNDL